MKTRNLSLFFLLFCMHMHVQQAQPIQSLTPFTNIIVPINPEDALLKENQKQAAALVFAYDIPTTSINEQNIQAMYGPQGLNISKEQVTHIKKCYCYLEFLIKIEKVKNDRAFAQYQSDFKGFLQPLVSGAPLMPTQALVATKGWNAIRLTPQDIVDSPMWQIFVQTMICDSITSDTQLMTDLGQANNQMFPYVPNIEAAYYDNYFQTLWLYQQSMQLQALMQSDQRERYLAQSTSWKNLNSSKLLDATTAFKQTDFYKNTHQASNTNQAVSIASPTREQIICYFMLFDIQSAIYDIITQDNVESILTKLNANKVSPNFFFYQKSDIICFDEFFNLKKLRYAQANNPQKLTIPITEGMPHQELALHIPNNQTQATPQNVTIQAATTIDLLTNPSQATEKANDAQAAALIFDQLPIASRYEKVIDTIYGKLGLNIPVEELNKVKKAYDYLEFLVKFEKIKKDPKLTHNEPEFNYLVQPIPQGSTLFPTQNLVDSATWKAIAITDAEITASLAWQNFIKSMICDCIDKQVSSIADAQQTNSLLFAYIPNIEAAYSVDDFTKLRLYAESLQTSIAMLADQQNHYQAQCIDWKNMNLKTLLQAVQIFKTTDFYTMTHNSPTDADQNKYKALNYPARELIVSYYTFSAITTNINALMTSDNAYAFLHHASSSTLAPNFFAQDTTSFGYLYDYLALQTLTEQNKLSPQPSNAIMSHDNSSSNNVTVQSMQDDNETEEEEPSALAEVVIQKIKNPFTKKNFEKAGKAISDTAKDVGKGIVQTTNTINKGFYDDFAVPANEKLDPKKNGVSQGFTKGMQGMMKGMVQFSGYLVDGLEQYVGTYVFIGCGIASLFDPSIDPYKERTSVMKKIDKHKAIIGAVLLTVLVVVILVAITVMTGGASAFADAAITTGMATGDAFAGAATAISEGAVAFAAAPLTVTMAAGAALLPTMTIAGAVYATAVAGTIAISIAAAADPKFANDLTKAVLLPIMVGMEAMTDAFTTGFIYVAIGGTWFGAGFGQFLGYPVNAQQEVAKTKAKCEKYRSTINIVSSIVITIVLTVAVILCTMGVGVAMASAIDSGLFGAQAAATAAEAAAASAALASTTAEATVVTTTATETAAIAGGNAAEITAAKTAQQAAQIAAKQAADLSAQATAKAAARRAVVTATQQLAERQAAEQAAQIAVKQGAQGATQQLASATAERQAAELIVQKTTQQAAQESANFTALQAQQTAEKQAAQAAAQASEKQAAQASAQAEKLAAQQQAKLAAQQAEKQALRDGLVQTAQETNTLATQAEATAQAAAKDLAAKQAEKQAAELTLKNAEETLLQAQAKATQDSTNVFAQAAVKGAENQLTTAKIAVEATDEAVSQATTQAAEKQALSVTAQANAKQAAAKLVTQQFADQQTSDLLAEHTADLTAKHATEKSAVDLAAKKAAQQEADTLLAQQTEKTTQSQEIARAAHASAVEAEKASQLAAQQLAEKQAEQKAAQLALQDAKQTLLEAQTKAAQDSSNVFAQSAVKGAEKQLATAQVTADAADEAVTNVTANATEKQALATEKIKGVLVSRGQLTDQQVVQASYAADVAQAQESLINTASKIILDNKARIATLSLAEQTQEQGWFKTLANNTVFDFGFVLGQAINAGFGVFSVMAAMNQDESAADALEAEQKSIQALWKYVEDNKVNIVQNEEAYLDELHKKHQVAVENQAFGLQYYNNFLNSSVNNVQGQIAQALAQQYIQMLTPDSQGLQPANIGSTWGLQTPFYYLYPSQGFITTTLGRPDFPYAQEVAQAPLESESHTTKSPIDLSDKQPTATKLWFNQRAISVLNQTEDKPLNVEIKFRVIYNLNTAYHVGLYLGGTYHDYSSTAYLQSIQEQGTIDLDDAHLAKMFVIKRDNEKAVPEIGVYEHEGKGWTVEDRIDANILNNASIYHMNATLNKDSLTVSFWSENNPSEKWTKTTTVTPCDQRTFGIIFSGIAIEWDIVQPLTSITENKAVRVASNGQSEAARERASKAQWKQLLNPQFGSMSLQAPDKNTILQGRYVYTTQSTGLTNEQGKPMTDYVVFATNSGNILSNIGVDPQPSLQATAGTATHSSRSNAILSLVTGNVYDATGKIIMRKQDALETYTKNNTLSQSLTFALQQSSQEYLTQLLHYTFGSYELKAVSSDALNKGLYIYTCATTIPLLTSQENKSAKETVTQPILDYLVMAELVNNSLGSTIGMQPSSNIEGMVSLVTGNVYNRSSATPIDSGYSELTQYIKQYGNIPQTITTAINNATTAYNKNLTVQEQAKKTTKQALVTMIATQTVSLDDITSTAPPSTGGFELGLSNSAPAKIIPAHDSISTLQATAAGGATMQIGQSSQFGLSF